MTSVYTLGYIGTMETLTIRQFRNLLSHYLTRMIEKGEVFIIHGSPIGVYTKPVKQEPCTQEKVKKEPKPCTQKKVCTPKPIQILKTPHYDKSKHSNGKPTQSECCGMFLQGEGTDYYTCLGCNKPCNSDGTNIKEEVAQPSKIQKPVTKNHSVHHATCPCGICKPSKK